MLTQNLAFGDPQESTQPCIRSEAASNKSRLACVQLCINATFPITLEVVVGWVLNCTPSPQETMP